MKNRISAARRLLEKNKLDVLLVTSPANRYYFSGFSGSSGYLLIASDINCLVTDFRYVEQAGEQTGGLEIEQARGGLVPATAALIREHGWSRIGFEGAYLTVRVFNEFKERLEADFQSLDSSLDQCRAVKSAAELAVIRRGAAILDEACEQVLTGVAPGMSERELALELEIFLRRRGALRPAFPFIVASGPRGSLPHGEATERKIAPGEMVTLDFGGIFDHYATDMTRTLALGEPDPDLAHVYEIVRRAQEEAVAAICPGRPCREVDAVARQVISEAGYGDNFGHGVGHGLGLQAHEIPTMGPRSEETLAEGMVVTVEPGIYLPGKGGVRIEDMVLVTAAGGERLTSSSRALLTV